MSPDLRTLIGVVFLGGIPWLLGYFYHICDKENNVLSSKWLWLICGAPPTDKRLVPIGVALQMTAYCIIPVILCTRNHLNAIQGLFVILVCGILVHAATFLIYRSKVRRRK